MSMKDLEAFFTEEPGGSGRSVDQGHYSQTVIQPIEVMQELMPPEQFIGFCRGNVIKYSLRAGRKDDVTKEVDKIVQYATWWRQALDGKMIDPMEGK